MTSEQTGEQVVPCGKSAGALWWLPAAAGFSVSAAMVVASVSAITLAFTVPVAALFLIASGWARGAKFSFTGNGRVALLAAAAFPLYAALSAVWSPAPQLALSKAALGAGLLALTAGAILVSRSATSEECRHFNRGLIVGFLIGLTFLCFENLTEQSGRMFVLNALNLDPEDISRKAYTWREGRIVAVSERDIVRNTAPFALLIVPAAIACLAFARRRNLGAMGYILPAGLFALTCTVIFLSGHETSKLAILAGMICVAAGAASLTWARNALIASWLAACFLVLPLSYVAYEAGLHKSRYLQSTARHRIGIWREYTENTLNAPIFGHGAHQARVIGPQIDAHVPETLRRKTMRKMSIHPHNAYVQVWFELGLVGIAIFAGLGLALLTILPGSSPPVLILSLASFAIAATMISSSYGLWQNWFLSTLAFCPIAIAYTARSYVLANAGDHA